MVRVFNTEDWTTPALAGTRIMMKEWGVLLWSIM
jgi:hypothetical protein